MSQNANLDGPCFIILLEGCFYDFLYFLVFTFGRYIFFSVGWVPLYYWLFYVCTNYAALCQYFSRLLRNFVCFFLFSRIVSVLFVHTVCCSSLILRCCVFLYVVAYRFYFFVHFFHFFFLILAKIGKMARMGNNSDYIDLSDPVDSVSISSVVYPECSVVGVRTLSS